MTKIIQFPTPTQPLDETDGFDIIDTTKKGHDLESAIGLFWHNLYSGQSIKEIYADDDGLIKYQLTWGDPDGPEKEELKLHMRCMLDFINKQGLAVEFLKVHEEMIEENGLLNYFVLKEGKPNETNTMEFSKGY